MSFQTGMTIDSSVEHKERYFEKCLSVFCVLKMEVNGSNVFGHQCFLCPYNEVNGSNVFLTSVFLVSI